MEKFLFCDDNISIDPVVRLLFPEQCNCLLHSYMYNVYVGGRDMAKLSSGNICHLQSLRIHKVVD